jgi:hypothetical protein
MPPQSIYLDEYYRLGPTSDFFMFPPTTALNLLTDYFTFIGGLFGLWFGICLESLLDLIVKQTRNLRTKVKLQVENILSFIYIFSLYILHCINDLIRNFLYYMLEKILSIQNRIIQFRTWFSDWQGKYFSGVKSGQIGRESGT